MFDFTFFKNIYDNALHFSLSSIQNVVIYVTDIYMNINPQHMSPVLFEKIQIYILNFGFNIYIWYLKNVEKYIMVKTPIIKEPLSLEWIDICSLLYVGDKYKLVNTNIINNKNVEDEYLAFYKSFYSNYNYSDDSSDFVTKEHVFIAKKKDNQYICKVCFPGHVKCIASDELNIESSNLEVEETDVEENKVSFLYIEYVHSKMMDTPIPLPFPNGLLQPLNELFTPAFILRQLQTQTNYYYFDMDYKITILDNNLNTFDLKSHQYILLHKNTYEIIHR